MALAEGAIGKNPQGTRLIDGGASHALEAQQPAALVTSSAIERREPLSIQEARSEVDSQRKTDCCRAFEKGLNFLYIIRGSTPDGGIAQLGERLHGMQEVSGSIPLTSTIMVSILETVPRLRPYRLEA